MFDQFVQSGLYLRGWSPKTATIYRRAYTSLQQSLRAMNGVSSDVSESCRNASVDALTKAQLQAWVISERQKGKSASGVNIYIRAINAYCSWLKDEGYVKEHIKLKQIKTNQRAITVLSSTEIGRFLKTKPKRLTYQRTWVLIALLLDTGVRIDEALSLTRDNVDFDNLLFIVRGKGSKERKVPFSPELRKHLWPYMQKTEGVHVFSTRNNTRLMYRNAYRNIKKCFQKCGVSGQHVHPHTTRHTFSCNFIKKGGSLVALSQILGHASPSVTAIYLRGLRIEDFERHSHSVLVGS